MTMSRALRTAGIVAVFASACTLQRRQPVQTAMDEHMSHMMPGGFGGAECKPEYIAGDARGFRPVRDSCSGLGWPRARVGSEWVKIAWEPGSKDSLMAWIVYPSTSNAKTPVVVKVIHEIFWDFRLGYAAWLTRWRPMALSRSRRI